MSTEWIDSFAVYENANGSIPLIPANQASLLRRWTNLGGNNTQTTTIGALHDSALQLELGASVSITLAQKAHWIVGFNYYFSGAMAAAGGNIWSFQNCDLGNARTLCRLQLNTDGTFTLFSGNGSTTINTSATAILANTWYYIELEVSYTGTTNILVQADLYLDATHITGGNALSAIDKASFISNTATTNYHTLGSGIGSGGPQAYIQDLYVFDGDAPANNAPLLNPDTTIGAIHPDGDVIQQLTRSAGTANFSLVNENPEDADTTYVAKATVAQQDVYDWEDLVFTGTIPTVQLSICGRKTDEDAKAFESTVGDTGGELQSAFLYLSNNYRYYKFPIDLDPATNLPWQVADFNVKRFGQRIVL